MGADHALPAAIARATLSSCSRSHGSPLAAWSVDSWSTVCGTSFERPIVVGDTVTTVSREELERTLSELRPGDELGLCNEPTNRANPRAILTTARGEVPLGWIPNLLVEEVHRIPDRRQATVTVRAVNGPDAGWHLRLLAKLSAAVPPGFDVLTDPMWEPLANPQAMGIAGIG